MGKLTERYRLGGMASVEEGSPPWSIIDTQPGARNPVEWVTGRDAAEKRVAELNARHSTPDTGKDG